MKISQKHFYRDIYEFKLLCDIVYRKDGDWRENAFDYNGLSIYSQFLNRFHGHLYRDKIDLYIQNGYILPCFVRINEDGSETQSYSSDLGLCKNYRLTKNGSTYYSECVLMIDKIPKVIKNSVIKRLNGYLQFVFDESLNVGMDFYHKKDNRYHTKWCVVPKELRHSFVTKSNENLFIDCDINSALPSIFCEILNDPENLLKLYKNESGFIKNQISKEEIQKYTKLFENGDFYENLIKESKTTLDRTKIKKKILSIYNSSHEQRKYNSDECKELYSYFENNFPTILDSFDSCKTNMNTYAGSIISKLIEFPIIQNFYDSLIKEFKRVLKIQYIFDGVEIFAKNSIKEQKKLEIIDKVVYIGDSIIKQNNYKFIRIKYVRKC